MIDNQMLREPSEGVVHTDLLFADLRTILEEDQKFFNESPDKFNQKLMIFGETFKRHEGDAKKISHHTSDEGQNQSDCLYKVEQELISYVESALGDLLTSPQELQGQPQVQLPLPLSFQENCIEFLKTIDYPYSNEIATLDQHIQNKLSIFKEFLIYLNTYSSSIPHTYLQLLKIMIEKVPVIEKYIINPQGESSNVLKENLIEDIHEEIRDKAFYEEKLKLQTENLRETEQLNKEYLNDLTTMKRNGELSKEDYDAGIKDNPYPNEIEKLNAIILKCREDLSKTDLKNEERKIQVREIERHDVRFLLSKLVNTSDSEKLITGIQNYHTLIEGFIKEFSDDSSYQFSLHQREIDNNMAQISQLEENMKRLEAFAQESTKGDMISPICDVVLYILSLKYQPSEAEYRLSINKAITENKINCQLLARLLLYYLVYAKTAHVANLEQEIFNSINLSFKEEFSAKFESLGKQLRRIVRDVTSSELELSNLINVIISQIPLN